VGRSSGISDLEVLICQSCGTVLRGKSKNCAGCGLIVSTHSPTTAPTLTNTNQALSVAVRPDPVVLERVLAKRAAGIDVYSKNYSLGGAYSGGNSSFGNNDNGSTDQYPGNGNSSTYNRSATGANVVTDPSSFFEPATQESSPGNNGFDHETSTSGNNDFQPPPSPPAPEPAQAPGNGAFNFAPAANSFSNPSEYKPENNQTEEPAAVPQSTQSISSNFVAAPQSAFMSNQTFEEASPAESTSSGAKPDFFATNPANPQPSPTTSQSQLPASAAQQRQSGSQNAITNSRAQQSLSGAQPPPMTTGVPRSVDTHSTMPPASAPKPEQAAVEIAVAPESNPPATVATASAHNDDDDLIEAPKSASQMDFFASSKFPATGSSATSNNAEGALSKSQRSTNREEASPFAEPDTRKFTRSKNKEKLDRLVEVPDEDADDEKTELKKSAKSELDEFGFDAPKKSKKIVEEGRKKNSDEDDDVKKYLKKSSKKKPAKDDDDDDDDDEDFAPPRRSFSGNAPASKRKTITKHSRKVVDDDDDDEDDDDDDDDDDDEEERNDRRSRSSGGYDHEESEEEDETSPPYVRFLKKPVRFLGFSMPRHMQLVVIGVFLVIVPMLFSCAAAVFTLGSDQIKALAPQEKMPLLTGDWHMEVMDNGKPFKTDIELLQIGDNIYAQGSDVRSFYIIGRLSKPDHIQFNKLYRLSDGSFDKPIEYAGDFDLSQGRPYARGFWRVEKRQGAFYKAHTVTFTGQWQMKQTRVRSHVDVPLPQGVDPAAAGAPGMGSTSRDSAGGPKKPLWQSCFEVAGFLLVGSIALVVLVWKSFGTNGTLSIMGKRQYIPSQYRGDHNKILGILGKPPRPGSMPLGQRCEWKPFFPWEKKDLCLPPEIRRKDPHMLLLGAGDKGKSRMIANLITTDIESNDRAVVLIDSDGALVDLVTRWISHHPKGRQFAKRVIVLDPTYKYGSLAYNPLEMPADGDLQAAASSLVYGFKAIYTEPPGSQSQWNQQTANILRNAALLLMANGKTLTDLPTLLQDNDFRDILLENIERKKKEKTEYGTLLETWGQYKKLARTDQWITWVEPILNRVGPMLSDPRIRPILTQAEGQIKLTKVIQEKQILLVKIKKGHLDQNANLLGSLIVTGLKQAAMSLSGQQKQKPVALYLDEFDNFIEKETFESITSETDKFQIGLVGALRTLQHLPEDFRNNLIINVGTIACFALSKKDGDLLGPQMFRVDGRKIKHQTMSNFFNPVNTSPTFELISDEEKLNIDRVVGQDARNFYAYRVGSQAGVFHMKTHDFNDIPERDVNHKIIDKMYGVSKKAADNDD
jgi:hypothetical protein